MGEWVSESEERGEVGEVTSASAGTGQRTTGEPRPSAKLVHIAQQNDTPSLRYLTVREFLCDLEFGSQSVPSFRLSFA